MHPFHRPHPPKFGNFLVHHKEVAVQQKRNSYQFATTKTKYTTFYNQR